MICDGPQSDSSLHLMSCSSGGWSKYNPLALTGHKVSEGHTATMKQTIVFSATFPCGPVRDLGKLWISPQIKASFRRRYCNVSLSSLTASCRLQSSYFACFSWTEKALYIFLTASRNVAVSCRVVNTLIQLVRASHIYKTWSKSRRLVEFSTRSQAISGALCTGTCKHLHSFLISDPVQDAMQLRI